MKRRHHKPDTGQCVQPHFSLPYELIVEIASHTKLCTIAEVYTFALINTQFHRSFPFTLKHWAQCLSDTWPPKAGKWGAVDYFRSHLKHQTEIDVEEFHILLKYRLLEAAPNVEFYTALFQLCVHTQHYKRWCLTWNDGVRVTPNCQSLTAMISHYSLKLDRIYMQNKDLGWTKAKKIDGLRTVDMPARLDRVKYREECTALIKQQCLDNKAIESLAIAGLSSTATTCTELRASYYDLKRTSDTPLKTHKPRRSARCIDIIVNGVHLWTKDNKIAQLIRQSLYVCNYEPRENESRNCSHILTLWYEAPIKEQHWIRQMGFVGQSKLSELLAKEQMNETVSLIEYEKAAMLALKPDFNSEIIQKLFRMDISDFLTLHEISSDDNDVHSGSDSY
jgi:hypothetical protein